MLGQSGGGGANAGTSAAAGSGAPATTAAGNGSISTAGTTGTARSGAGGAAGSGTSGSGASGNAAASGSAAAGNAAAGSGGAAAGASAAGAAGASAAAGTGSTATAMAWPPVADFGKTGPFMSMTKNNDGPMGGYTLYYPQDLGRDGLKHPFITWGNGAGTTPVLYMLLPLLASQGFVIIASNNSAVTGALMKSGLDWLVMENDRQGSTFYQKLDTTKVASMGYSLGSLGTFEIANDPRIKTTVHISGGAMNKAVVPNLKNPAVFLCGDESDIAHANCETDFQMATVPVFYGVFPGDHFGILGSFTAQIHPAVGAWLRWRLMDDASLATWFVGPDCMLCKDSKWTVKQKMFDKAP